MSEKIVTVLKKKSGLLLLITGILIGLLLIFSDTDPTTETTSEKNHSEVIEEYTNNLENKLERLINEIDGVSDVNVMITLKSGSEYIYASDDSDTSEKHVIVDNAPIYVKEYLPTIEGVAVVCKGGGNAVSKAKITELICSVLGLYSTHVYVTE